MALRSAPASMSSLTAILLPEVTAQCRHVFCWYLSVLLTAPPNVISNLTGSYLKEEMGQSLFVCFYCHLLTFYKINFIKKNFRNQTVYSCLAGEGRAGCFTFNSWCHVAASVLCPFPMVQWVGCNVWLLILTYFWYQIQAWQFVLPDLGQNCLQRSSADNRSWL